MIGDYGTKSIDTDSMSNIDILNKVINSKLTGVMLHDDMQQIFDFLNLRGYKREQEYRTLDEMAEYKGLCRYMINVNNVFPNKEKSERIEIKNLSALKTVYRNEIKAEQKQRIIKELFELWREWEKETIEELEIYTTKLAQINKNKDAKVTRKLLEDTVKELKYLERQIIELEDVNYELHHIYCLQNEIHEKFKEKTENEIKINFC